MEEKIEYMKQALKEAKKAEEKKEVPIGAVIVKDKKIISRGHNMRETKKNSIMHAEIIAIDKACKKLKNFRLENCDLYVTIEPCLMCSGAIIQARIRKVYYGSNDFKYGAVESVAQAFDIKSNHKVEYEKGICEQECSSIVSNFFRRIRNNKIK